MAEDDCCFVAASALDIHEIGVGGGDKSFEFVLFFLGFKGGVEKITVHVCC